MLFAEQKGLAVARRFQRRGQDLNIIPSMGAREPNEKNALMSQSVLSGEGGI